MSSPSPPEVRVCNIVATFALADHPLSLDLAALAARLPSTTYTPRRFGALVHRQKEEEGTALIFRSGSCVLTGCKTMACVALAAERVARDAGSSGVHNLRVRNVVGHFRCAAPLNLSALYEHLKPLRTKTIYEPEVYGALRHYYYPTTTKKPIVFLAFYTGAVIVTGASDVQTLVASARDFYASTLCYFYLS